MIQALFLLLGCALMLSMPIGMLIDLWGSIQEHGFFRTIKNVATSLLAVALVLGGLSVCGFILWLVLCGGPGNMDFIRGD
jgi:hypothetical protein